MKTAQTCITNAENIIAEFADKLTDEGRADLAAVVAMAKCDMADHVFQVAVDSRCPEDADAACDALYEAKRVRNSALAAAGVEVKREG